MFAPCISPQLQGGLCWGADMMAGSLMDVSPTHTFVAFVDIRHLLGGSNNGGVVLHGVQAHVGLDCTFCGTFSQVRSGADLSEPCRTQVLPRAECSLRCSSTFSLMGLHVHDACPGVSLMARWDSCFAGQFYADSMGIPTSVHVRSWAIQIRRHDFWSAEEPPCMQCDIGSRSGVLSLTVLGRSPPACGEPR